MWLCGFDDGFCAAKRHEAAQKSTVRRAAGSSIGYEVVDLADDSDDDLNYTFRGHGPGANASGTYSSGYYVLRTAYGSYSMSSMSMQPLLGVRQGRLQSQLQPGSSMNVQPHFGARQGPPQSASASPSLREAETTQQKSDRFTNMLITGLNQILPSQTAKEPSNFD